MKYIAFFFCGLSFGLMAGLYAYASTVSDIPPHQYQGGFGFTINFPMWSFGILALATGSIGAVLLAFAVIVSGKTALQSWILWMSAFILAPTIHWWARAIWLTIKYR